MPTQLPATARRWQLYDDAPFEVVAAINEAVQSAANDTAFDAVLPAARRVYNEWGATRLDTSEAYKAIRRVQSQLWWGRIDPVLNAYAAFGASDSEPRDMARRVFHGLVLNRIGVRDNDRVWVQD